MLLKKLNQPQQKQRCTTKPIDTVTQQQHFMTSIQVNLC